MISVIISTKNRPEKLNNCLKSILSNNFNNYEVLVFDQSDKKNSLELKDKKVKYFYTLSKGLGKSKNLNLGIKKANGEIIAFTDDDCVVSKSWLIEIDVFFKKNSKVSGVFGNTLPLEKTRKENLICPATFISKKILTTNDPHTIQHLTLGQGNNMAIRKEVFKKVGLFKTWLGVGSVCKAGEDTDMIFRLLKSNFQLANIPKIIVYHDRWLSYDEENILQASYTMGIAGAYFYNFCKSGDLKLLSLILRRINERLSYKLESLAKVFNKKELQFIFLEIKATLSGILISIFHL